MKGPCPRCGLDNECKSAIGCWCASIVFTQELKDYCDKNYKGMACLCQNCVKELNNGKL